MTRPSRIALPKLTDRLTLGGARLRVSPFCVGYVRTPKAIPAAFDAGINFFFLSADMHWPLYEEARRGLELLLKRGPKIRRQIVVAVVLYPTQPEFCSIPLKETLDAVPGLGTIDVAVAGGVYAHEFLTRLPVFQRHRESGYLGVKAIGASFHDRQAAVQAVNHHMVDIAYVRYNPSHPGGRQDLFPKLTRKRKTLVYNFTNTHGAVSPERFAGLGLGDEYWQPRRTDYHRFALTRPELDGLLCSPSTPKEITTLAKALKEGPLDDEEEKYLVDLAALDEGRARLES